MSFLSISYDGYTYKRDPIDSILPIMEEKDNLLSDTSSIDYPLSVNEQNIEVLLIYYSIENRNRYVEYKMEKMFFSHEFSNNEEFTMRKLLYVDYYLLNRMHQCKDFIQYAIHQKQEYLKKERKINFFKLWYKWKGSFHLQREQLYNRLDNVQDIINRMEKEMEDLKLMSMYIKATIELKNTSLFRLLQM